MINNESEEAIITLILKRLRGEISDYKQAVELLNDHVKKHNNVTVAELKRFHNEYEKLVHRLNEVQESINAHAIGVQNVYKEFSAFRDKYINDSMNKIDALIQ